MIICKSNYIMYPKQNYITPNSFHSYDRKHKTISKIFGAMSVLSNLIPDSGALYPLMMSIMTTMTIMTMKIIMTIEVIF